MALITELELTTYCTARGITPPTNPSQAITKATDYIEAVYYDSLVGYKVDDAQAYLFPRYDDYGILMDETSMKKAACSLAVRADTIELFEDSSKMVVEEKLDTLSVKYNPDSSQKTSYSDVAKFMQPYLKSGSGRTIVRV